MNLIVVLIFIWLGARLGSIGIDFAGGFGVLVLGFVFGLAPIVTYTMTLFAGTGHTAFSTLPVIAEVAKREGIRPSRPLAIATVASQIAITASPISAAVVFFSTELEKVGVDYVQLLLITIPSSFIAVMLAAVITNFIGKDLKDDPIYQERLAKGQVKMADKEITTKILPSGAKLSVAIFGIALFCVVFYATAISDTVGLIKEPVLARDHAIITFMLAAATLITLFCKIDAKNILNASTFKSGMSACICVLGVAWLGTTFVAAVEFDDTGSTRIGKYVFDHPFLIPGTPDHYLCRYSGFSLWQDYSLNLKNNH